MNDLIFDIKEFGLHDGNGMRTTVFFKGCPLRCEWCHNPEGQEFSSELIRNGNKCLHCNLCKRQCNHRECEGLGVCLKVCPQNCLQRVGESYTPEALAEKLLSNERFLRLGGVTFSGGEPLCHSDFIVETVKRLRGFSTAVETCGYVSTEQFLKGINAIDDIFYDIKLFDRDAHKKYTGVYNDLILHNALTALKAGRFITFRVPLIPGVTDTNENLTAIATFLREYSQQLKVELIPYNTMTGAKYKSVGREYKPSFDEKQKLNKNTKIFFDAGITHIAF